MRTHRKNTKKFICQKVTERIANESEHPLEKRQLAKEPNFVQIKKWTQLWLTYIFIYTSTKDTFNNSVCNLIYKFVKIKNIEMYFK